MKAAYRLDQRALCCLDEINPGLRRTGSCEEECIFFSRGFWRQHRSDRPEASGAPHVLNSACYSCFSLGGGVYTHTQRPQADLCYLSVCARKSRLHRWISTSCISCLQHRSDSKAKRCFHPHSVIVLV